MWFGLGKLDFYLETFIYLRMVAISYQHPRMFRTLLAAPLCINLDFQ